MTHKENRVGNSTSTYLRIEKLSERAQFEKTVSLLGFVAVALSTPVYMSVYRITCTILGTYVYTPFYLCRFI